MTRQELRNRNPVFTCSRPAPVESRSIIERMKDAGYGLPTLALAALVAALIHVIN